MSREEEHVVEALVALCVQLKVTCVVQVGAEDGYEANAILLETGCRAVCIDPDPKCRPVSPDLEFHEVVIGARNSVTDFYIHHERGLSGQLRRGDGNEITLTMPQVQLWTFCQNHSIVPDALIIDTEGTTLDVLAGAGELLESVNVVYAECQTYNVKAIDTVLSAFGLVQRAGLPSYDCGSQGNYTWVRP